MIHINRNRQALGQFSEQEVADGLKSGRFSPDDLAWQQGMDSWQPLSTFTDLPGAVDPASGEAAEVIADVRPAWESASPAPVFQRLFESIKQIFSLPGETFRAMPVSGGFATPLKFYILISWASSIVAVAYQVAAAYINPSLLTQKDAATLPSYFLPMVFVAVIVLMPLLYLVGIFISSALIHGALMLAGGAKKPFEATFRALCYSGGATSVLQVVPLCGGWLSSVAWLIYSVISLKEVHRTDLWRPIVAIVAVGLIFCGLIAGLSILAVSAAGLASGAIK